MKKRILWQMDFWKQIQNSNFAPENKKSKGLTIYTGLGAHTYTREAQNKK